MVFNFRMRKFDSSRKFWPGFCADKQILTQTENQESGMHFIVCNYENWNVLQSNLMQEV